MVKIYREQDTDLNCISDKRILLLGYGSQGRAFALNLKDSEITVDVCLQSNGKSADKARSEGFRVITPDEIIIDYDIIIFLIPDHLHGEFYGNHLEAKLKENACLVFAHGYSIQFGIIKPPDNVDVILVAPHGPGDDVRIKYTQGSGVSCYVAVKKNHSGTALDIALAIANAIGSARVGVVETTFEHEALGDLFGEQALLCGGLADLVIKCYEILVKNGIPRENAYLETAHQIDLLASLIKKYGIHGMTEHISMTAQYGMLKVQDRIIDNQVVGNLQKLYEEIRAGNFAWDWQNEYETGLKNLHEFKKRLRNHPIEKTAEKIKGNLE